MMLKNMIDERIFSKLKDGPEQKLVVGPIVAFLVQKGWSLDQIVFGKHEWQIPKTPAEATKRQKGQSFEYFPVDIAVFDDPSNIGNYRSLLFVIECKQPDESAGLQQLETYLGLEPHAKLGIWANNPDISAEALFVYKDTAGLQYPKKKSIKDLPSVGTKIDQNAKKLCFQDLVIPSNDILRKTFSDLLDRVVARDSNVTRREDQLDQLCNIILLKLESDKQGRADSDGEVFFAPRASESITGSFIKEKFSRFAKMLPDIFIKESDQEIRFSNATIHLCVEELSKLNLIDVSAETVSFAFQVLRSAALKQEEGQYFTPRTVIEAAVKYMRVGWDDLILDPACGTGGFLIQCLLEMKERYPSRGEDISRWAQLHLFGIDKDAIGIKLTKAVMQILGDGSAHCVRGDSVLTHTWSSDYPHLQTNHFKDGRFSLIFTNPPFGAPLTIAREDAKKAHLSIINSQEKLDDIELGLAMFNRCYDLLAEKGRLCIVLPETYFFSPSYKYVRSWAKDKLKPVAVINVPMEAFQGFCRAKTNLYIFEKISNEDEIKKGEFIEFLNPKSCGVYKNGGLRFKVDTDGKRGEVIDNELLEHVQQVCDNKTPEGYYKVSTKTVLDKDVLVPRYYDHRWEILFDDFIKKEQLEEITIGELEDNEYLLVRGGHGSPSNDQRVGDIPYVKVSDIRNLRINVNPTNLVPYELAKKFWRSEDGDSGIRAWDLLTPNRASSNIGEFAIILPGEERILLTKEVLIFRFLKGDNEGWDPFYLLWALSLKSVRQQWQRVTLMQTNREDVASRYKEIRLPKPKSKEWAYNVSSAFRTYFETLAVAREKFQATIKNDGNYYIASVASSGPKTDNEQIV